MINSADKFQISDILDNKSIRYLIPKYQREYTWSKDNWEELLDDIFDSDGSHFIGSIICINNNTPLIQEYELVDGQQRLTTLSILFCSIYSLLKNYSNADNSDRKLLSLEMDLIESLILEQGGNTFQKIQLSEQNNNNNDYKSILVDLKLLDDDCKIKNRGNRRIYKAYKFFNMKLDTLNKDELLLFTKKLYTTLLVLILVDSHSDAFLLFESLNNRGVPLSAIDLIKNKLLAELEKKNIMDIDKAFEKWNIIINNLNEFKLQERFLRHYYNAFKIDSGIKVDGYSKATRSNIIKIYEKLISNNTDFIFNDLINKSKIYHDLLSPEESESQNIINLKNKLNDLINVKAAPSYQFLLYIFSKDIDDQNFYSNILELLVKYFLRRNITDFPNTRNLDQIFIDLISNINEDENNRLNYEYIKKYLINNDRFETDELFEKKLSGDLYDLNTDATRFILSKIEEGFRNKEDRINLWEVDSKKKLIFTIEHIFPEGKNIPEKWIDMIANGNKELAEEIQLQYVHKLGNLTLTGFNSNLSNFDFIKKRDRKDGKNNKYIGYKNGLYLNKDLEDKNQWTKYDIEERTSKLVKITMERFNII